MSFTIYSKDGCSFCVKAKVFMDEFGIPYKEIKFDSSNSCYLSDVEGLFQRSGQRTFPQIFVGSIYIGGYNELVKSYRTQELHRICEANNIPIE